MFLDMLSKTLFSPTQTITLYHLQGLVSVSKIVTPENHYKEPDVNSIL